MKTKIDLQLISAEQTYALRHQVLRPHQDFAAVKYADDLAPGTFHIGAKSGNQIVGVATFSKEPHIEVMKIKSAQNPYRLRGMATAFNFHQRGIGAAVLHFAFAELQRRECDLLWCNARENAFPFYEKLGFHFLGELFEIADIGPHKVMYKPL